MSEKIPSIDIINQPGRLEKIIKKTSKVTGPCTPGDFLPNGDIKAENILDLEPFPEPCSDTHAVSITAEGNLGKAILRAAKEYTSVGANDFYCHIKKMSPEELKDELEKRGLSTHDHHSFYLDRLKDALKHPLLEDLCSRPVFAGGLSYSEYATENGCLVRDVVKFKLPKGKSFLRVLPYKTGGEHIMQAFPAHMFIEPFSDEVTGEEGFKLLNVTRDSTPDAIMLSVTVPEFCSGFNPLSRLPKEGSFKIKAGGLVGAILHNAKLDLMIYGGLPSDEKLSPDSHPEVFDKSDLHTNYVLALEKATVNVTFDGEKSSVPFSEENNLVKIKTRRVERRACYEETGFKSYAVSNQDMFGYIKPLVGSKGFYYGTLPEKSLFYFI